MRASYHTRLDQLRTKFFDALNLEHQKRGYELEKIFGSLMEISDIPYEKPYKITGEQIDSAIKHEGHYYLIELKWVESKADQRTIASLYMKVEGKLESRGLFISMQGYTDEVLSSLPRAKEIKVLLLDGIHLTNVITGIYTFQELLNHAINYASLRGEIYCPHEIA
jgi:hypothetical protein